MRLGYALVLILLPPSEAKATPTAVDLARGSPLDLAALSFPDLTPTRSRVLDALVRLSRGPKGKARVALGLSPNQDAELERNQQLWEAPTRPAGETYTGVLYDALARSALPAPARRRLDDSVVVMSALFGVVRLTDHIPAYRLSGDARLPRIGRVGTAWRRPLAGVLADMDTGVVFDLRSSTYSAMWAPSGDLAERTVVGRVLQRRPDGSVQVVSHFNKATKGRLVGALVRRRTLPGSVDQLVAAVADLGYDVTLVEACGGRAHRLDVVVADLK